MADFVVRTEIVGEELRVNVRRADGQVKNYSVALKWVRQWQKFGLIQDLIVFMVGSDV